MKRATYLFALVITLLAAAATEAISAGYQLPAAPAFSRYQGILERMPFGAPPAVNTGVALNPADAKSAALDLKEQQLLARQINMSCVNVTPAGKIAVGFTDMASKPPISYYLLVGDSSNGWAVKSADYDAEWAELEKDGVSIYVKLGEGLMAEPPERKEKPPAAPVLADTKPLGRPDNDEPDPLAQQRPGFIRRPPGNGIPSVPVNPMLAHLKEVKQRAEDLKKIKEEGGDAIGYMKSYSERRQEKANLNALAEQAARDQVQEMAKKITREELKKIERELNLSLIDQGAQPISDIELTADEESVLFPKDAKADGL